MKKSLYKFRNDLRNGLTIAEACTKHNITFKYAVDNMERPYTKNRKPNRRSKCTSTKASLNIYRIGKGGFTIYKSVNSRSQNFGTYRTLEDAVKIAKKAKVGDLIKVVYFSAFQVAGKSVGGLFGKPCLDFNSSS